MDGKLYAIQTSSKGLADSPWPKFCANNKNTGCYTYIPTHIHESFIPKEYILRQNHPNPFNPTTTIGYTLPEPIHVRMEIFNIHGEKVISLIDSH
jgi:hypothetical protein